MEEENLVVNAMIDSKLPKFTCEDGVNCVFEINALSLSVSCHIGPGALAVAVSRVVTE